MVPETFGLFRLMFLFRVHRGVVLFGEILQVRGGTSTVSKHLKHEVWPVPQRT